MKYEGIKKITLKAMITVLLLSFCMIVFAGNTYAATLKTIPSTSVQVSDGNKLKLCSSNYSVKWTGVSGKVYDSTIDGASCKEFCVPIKSTTAAFTYTDFLDIAFTNIGQVNGRQMDAKVHFNSMTVQEKTVTTSTGEGSYMAVGYLNDTSFWMGASIAAGGHGYRASRDVDVTVTMYWHDTGKTVELPFFQCIKDIDAPMSATTTYYLESWEAVSGFTGVFYKYSSNTLKFSGNKAMSTYTPTSGEDCLLKTGFYAPTTGGSFRSVFTDGNCATEFITYSAYAIMDNPVKTSNGKDINLKGDTIDYTVKQKMGTFYADTMTTYKSFVMSDELPEGVAYKLAKVYDGAGADITSQGTMKYEAQTRKVTFTMGSAWLANINNYTGQTITMKIAVTVEEPTEPMKTVTNTARTLIDDVVVLISNDAEDVIAVPYGVKYEYVSGTAGKELPGAVSTTKGKYKISDTAVYYHGDTVARKALPADGTEHEVSDGDGRYTGKWILTWDAVQKTVSESDVVFTGTWRYVPAPRLVIVKKLACDDEQFTAAHGEPTFLFKVTASSGKTWYKSITFTSDMLDTVKTDAVYTGSSGEQFKLCDGCIYGACEEIYLPEEEYKVEELDCIRFDEVRCTAQYHNDDGTEPIGIAKTSITVPLKLSSYKAGSAGFDVNYASVVFENDKTDWSRLSHSSVVINKTKETD